MTEAVSYRLEEAAALSRARATSAIASLAELAPLALVLVLLHRLRYAAGIPLYVVAGAIVVLTAARAWVKYRRLARKLRALEVAVVDGEALVVDTEDAQLRVPRADIRRVLELPGTLGGLRVELAAAPPLPERVDIPRGGERFGELRAALEGWHAIERPPRRRRTAWIVIAIVFVAGIFFLPFVLDDVVARSRYAVLALVLGTWFVLRMLMQRR